MDGHAGSADLGHECFATGLEFLVIRWTEWRLGGAGKNDVTHFEFIDRTIARSSERADFLRDPQRGFACFIARADIANQCGINRFA